MLPFWKNMTEVKYRLLTTHEVGHALETKDTDWKRHSSDRKRVGLMNVLEDARIESLMKARFPGVRSDFFRGYQEFFDEDFFAIKKLTKTPDEFKNIPFPSRMNLHAKIGAFTKVPFSEKEKPFVDRMMALRTFPELEVLMEDILRFIAENKKAEEKKKAEQPKKDPETGLFPSESNDTETKLADQDQEEDEDEAPADPSKNDKGEDGEPEKSEQNEDGEPEGSDENEGSPAPSSSENGEDGNEEDADEEFDSSDSSGSGGGFNSSETDEITQEAFDNNLERMRDFAASIPRYIKIPEDPDLTDFILPWKNFLEILRLEERTIDRARLKDRSVAKFRSFMSATNPVVSYMIKEFETKKSADRFSRQRQAKTGVINPSKLHAYKTESDIFRRLTVLPEDKSHGLVMFIDFSASMWANLEGTMMQLLNLVVFCRKVGIPHRVYGFTDGRVRSVSAESTSVETANILSRIAGSAGSFSSAANQKIGYIDIRTNLKLLELFSEKMRNNEFVDMARMLLLISTSSAMASRTFDLGGTPLYETMIVARKMINNFRLETKAQIVNTIFLTDGDGRTPGGTFTDGSGYTSYGTGDAIVMDPQTKRQMVCESVQDMATFLMIALQDVTGTRAVSFRIEGSVKRCAEKAMSIMNGVKSDARFRRPRKALLKNLRADPSFDKVYTDLKADKMFVIPGGEGYAEYYMIVGGDELKTEANTFNVATKSGDKIGKISSAFVKSNRGRGTSRVLLGRFVAIIA